MPDLSDFGRLLDADHHLGVFTVVRKDGTVGASLTSTGVMDDPVDGTPGVAIVAAGGTVKLSSLRRDGRATVVANSGWEWAAVSGAVRLVGPDDNADGLDVPAVVRSVFKAAGGTHEDWAEFDRVMAEERRCAVFVHAERITGNMR